MRLPEKRVLLHLLDRSQGAEGVQLFIGEESGYDVLDRYSVVTSRYEVDSEVVGVLGSHRPDPDGLWSGSYRWSTLPPDCSGRP